MVHGQVVPGRFRPARWLANRHLQTLWPVWFKPAWPFSVSTERLELPDGDFVDLAWTPGGSGPVVIVLHGLEGGLASSYVIRMMTAIHARGWRGVLLQFRGCSGIPNRLDRSYHSGDTGDLDYLLDVLRHRYPEAPLAAVGYSLGGNVLLKYLGEQGAGAALSAAVAVSVPFDLDDCATAISKGFSRVYQRYLVGSLKRKVRAKFSGTRRSPVDLRRLEAVQTFHEFDDLVTAPLNGFAGVDDYYTRSSSRQYLGTIVCPSLILHASDDPFMTPAVIPEGNELGENVILEVSPHGGHVGFIGSDRHGRAECWLEPPIIDFLDARLT